jgi:hypothetical protein
MCKKIIVRRLTDKSFTITADGKTRKGYVSKKDAAEWIGTMQAHGLFKGYKSFIETDTGSLSILNPTYKNPCTTPAICNF